MASDLFVQQLLQERGTKLPDLSYMSFGDPTTYGTQFLYSEEVTRSMQQPRVAKGTMNKGTFGPTESPWAEVPKAICGKATSIYGQDFQRLERDESKRFNAAQLRERNAEMKQKQRQAAVERQAYLFRNGVEEFDTHMQNELDKYNRAQQAFEHRTARVYGHEGVSIRSKLSVMQQHAQFLDRVQAREEVYRGMVPQRAAMTPAPTLEMLKTVDDSLLPVPLRAASVTGDNAGMDDTAHVYPADKQRIKFLRLEAARHAKNKEALVQQGWQDTTNPLGPDKQPLHPEDASGLDSTTLAKIDQKVRAEHDARATRDESRAAKRQETLQKRVQELNEAAQAPGVNPRAKQTAQQLMADLLQDASAQITVPKDLGIVPPTSEDTIAALASNLPSGLYKTSTSGAVPAIVPLPTRSARPDIITNTDANGEPLEAEQIKAGRRSVHTHLPRNAGRRDPLCPTHRDVDRELKVVRDGGHMRKERVSVLKTLDPQRIAYIKSMGAGAGRGQPSVPMNAAMRPAPQPKASLLI